MLMVSQNIRFYSLTEQFQELCNGTRKKTFCKYIKIDWVAAHWFASGFARVAETDGTDDPRQEFLTV
jgi:hypothetical protein